MLDRRAFLGVASLGPALLAGADGKVSREVFLGSPAKGTAVIATAAYTSLKGGEMSSVEQRYSRSDTVDVAYYRYSKDYGKTWGAPVERKTGERRPEGMLRRHPRTSIVDPKTGRWIEFHVEGILPSDDPLEGMRQWNVFYTISGVVHQIVHEGEEFDARHPLPGIYTGKNMVMLGDVASTPLPMKDGSILLPAVITPIDAEGRLYNPGGGYTWTDAMVLHGRWSGGKLVWRASEPVKGDPRRCTRGMDEPTLAQLPNGRLMMVMRGSNDKKPALPAHKWVSWSSDGGFHWTEPQPWTYTDGTAFFSPSACSQLLRHSNGRLYWIGHISATNARGNRPRFPVYLGEVDQENGLLIRDSLIRIDDRVEGEDEILMLYSIFAREDRLSGGIALHMTRLFAFEAGWVGDALLYRIRV